ncbi:DUF4386 domain-containing protein [Thalassovita taeanensis]|uniref:DUF4386 domain-containing protein n=1 Tax=Thalassovita taeanensis TaxID=657014 RepID=A0A1H9EK72_9RHOB|nr:DUF4386 domain-containing protein [Thalassovita taeanensis]SEQ26002.1 protein of unknown function [Thalassovita taeanensis]
MTTLSLTRLTGLFYLLIIILGMTTELAIRAPLIDPDSAATTAANIKAHATLYRFGILGDAGMILADIAVAVLFYVLLKPVSQPLALTAMALRLVQAATLAANLVTAYAPLLLIGADDILAHRFALLHATGYDLGLIFFGVNCLVMGLLIHRAPFLPAPLGWLIGASGLVYLTGSTVAILAPPLASTLEPAYLLPLMSETAFCLWLLLSPKPQVR